MQQALFDAALFRLLLPRFLDGGEVDPLTFVQVIEEIAKHDASAAWCLCQAAGCSMTAAYLKPETAREIFGAPHSVLAWGPSNDASAVAVDGGYRINGTWSFASGCRHATWLGGYCPIQEPDGKPRRRPDGTADGRTMLFPAGQATIVDVWHVTGLRGTGSDAFTVTDLFVPREHSVSRDDPAERRQPGPLYCFPSGSLYASGFSGVAMGLARSSLDAFIELARDKEPRSSKRLVRDSALIQFQVAEAEGKLGAARVFLHDTLGRIWADVSRSGRPLSLHVRHPPGQARGGYGPPCGRVERHLHQQRLRAPLPRHPHRDPAAPGPPGPPRDRRSLPSGPRARPDLFIGHLALPGISRPGSS